MRRNPDPMIWWILGGSLLVVGGVVYVATKNQTPATPATPAPTPVPSTPAASSLTDAQNAAAVAAANAAAQNAAAVAMAALNAPTALPGGTKYSLSLAPGGTVQVQLNVGDTVGLSFPGQQCGINWTSAIGVNPSPVTVSPPNVMTAVQPGQVQATFSCGISGVRTTVDVNVLQPNVGVTLQQP